MKWYDPKEVLPSTQERVVLVTDVNVINENKYIVHLANYDFKNAKFIARVDIGIEKCEMSVQIRWVKKWGYEKDLIQSMLGDN